MSEVIRSFRLENAPYRKGQGYPEDRKSPFMFPKFSPKRQVPQPMIELPPGVPPIGKPREDRTDT
jgi:hypothetical protein